MLSSFVLFCVRLLPVNRCDKWKLSEAPSRQVRRLMLRDNAKERRSGKMRVRSSPFLPSPPPPLHRSPLLHALCGVGVRQYNEHIRELVAFVRKKDPRVALMKV
jgi:hypothetical protein